MKPPPAADSPKDRRAHLGPHLLAGASLGAYLWLAVLRGYSRPGDVLTFVGLMAVLFVLYFGILHQLRKGFRPSARTILIWAVLFRLALLPAGLGDLPGLGEGSGRGGLAGRMVEGFVSDLRGEQAYASHQLYDNDVWRYLWDGHQSLSGIDPYRYSPAEVLRAWDEEESAGDSADLASLLEDDRWLDVHDRVSYQAYRTVYPPLAQALFALSGWLRPTSVAMWKLLLIAFDLGTCLLLLATLERLGRSASSVVIYAWCPLVVGEVAGSGHVDALLVFCLASAVYFAAAGRPLASSLAAVAAVLAKLVPILILPFFLLRLPLRRWPWPLGFLALGLLPVWPSGRIFLDSLAAFARDWVFNPGPWLWIESASHALGFEGRGVADGITKGVTLVVVAAAALYLLITDRDLLADDGDRFDRLVLSVTVVLGVYLVLSPTVMPWYLIWVLPSLALRPESRWTVPWLVFSAFSTLSYLIYIDGIEQPWWAATQVSAAVLAMVWSLARSRRRAQ